VRYLVLPAGTKGVDTSARTSRAQYDALFAAGRRFVMRTVGHSPGFEEHNLGSAEMGDATGAGLAVGLFGQYRKDGWSYETGLADAKMHVEQAIAAGYAPGSTLWLDLEGGNLPDRTLLAAYSQAWCDYVRGPSPFWAGAYRVRWWPLKIPELTAQGFSHIWDAADGTRPLEGAEVVQDPQTTVAGVVVDTDTLRGMACFTAADEHETEPAPPPTMSQVRAVYLEIASSFVGLDAGSQRTRYEDAIMPQPPEPDVAHRGYDEASGCALWQRCFIRQAVTRLGLRVPAQLVLPYRMSRAIVDVLEMGTWPSGPAWRHPARPFVLGVSELPRPGDVVYIGGSDGTYEHVFCVEDDANVIQGGVIVNGHQGVNRGAPGWNVRGGVLYCHDRRVNGWADLDAMFATFV
jgi:hypothetical protein